MPESCPHNVSCTLSYDNIIFLEMFTIYLSQIHGTNNPAVCLWVMGSNNTIIRENRRSLDEISETRSWLYSLRVSAHWQLLVSVIKLFSRLKIACCSSQAPTGNWIVASHHFQNGLRAFLLLSWEKEKDTENIGSIHWSAQGL